MNKTKIMESEPCRDTYHQTLTTLTGFPDQHKSILMERSQNLNAVDIYHLF